MKLRPNRIMSQPATVEACADDRRTKAEQQIAAGAARTQQAEARQHAADNTTAKVTGKAPAKVTRRR